MLRSVKPRTGYSRPFGAPKNPGKRHGQAREAINFHDFLRFWPRTQKCCSSLNTAVNTKTTTYLERPEMDTVEVPPFRQRPPHLASNQSREGGNHHTGRVTRALQRKISEKVVKNTDFHPTPGSDLRREADCRVLPLLNNAALGQASHRIQ